MGKGTFRVLTWELKSIIWNHVLTITVISKNLWKKGFVTPFYGWDATAAKLQSHYEGIVYFLALSYQKFLALIWLTLEEGKAESTLELLSRKFVYI